MDQIAELERLANKHGITIYNICHRNAGWGIQWSEPVEEGNMWKSSLVVHAYRPTLVEVVDLELQRFRDTAEPFATTQ